MTPPSPFHSFLVGGWGLGASAANTLAAPAKTDAATQRTTRALILGSGRGGRTGQCTSRGASGESRHHLSLARPHASRSSRGFKFRWRLLLSGYPENGAEQRGSQLLAAGRDP